MNWVDFYKKRINSSYQEYFEKRYRPFLESIPHAEFIIEAGCGIGSTTKALRKGKAFDLYQTGSAIDNGVDVYTGNILAIEDYPKSNRSQTIIHSHGVLEHFDDLELRRIIEIQKTVASLSVHYIPSGKYTCGTFGDERLMPKTYWEQFGRVETFNDGFDYILFVM